MNEVVDHRPRFTTRPCVKLVTHTVHGIDNDLRLIGRDLIPRDLGEQCVLWDERGFNASSMECSVGSGPSLNFNNSFYHAGIWEFERAAGDERRANENRSPSSVDA